MKALTIRQPWASLIARGHKTIETRSWPTSYRGPLAIHAGASWESGWICWYDCDPKGDAAAKAHALDLVGVSTWEDPNGSYSWYPNRRSVPLGAILATATLVDCIPIEDARVASPDQVPFGDFTPGRWAWLLADVTPMRPPVPAKGRLGLWEWSA